MRRLPTSCRASSGLGQWLHEQSGTPMQGGAPSFPWTTQRSGHWRLSARTRRALPHEESGAPARSRTALTALGCKGQLEATQAQSFLEPVAFGA